jgi:hypothetical protein
MNTQMTTPINTLPLKTTLTQSNETDLDDPMIQNVLREFEDEMVSNKQAELPQQQLQEPLQNLKPMVPQYAPQPYQQYDTKPPKKLFDMDVAKKTLIIAIIVFLLQQNNVLSILTTRLPESLNTYISGRELLINFLIIFSIFYAIIYLELI